MPFIVYTAATTAFVAKTRHARVRMWGAGGTGGPAKGVPSTTGGGSGGQHAAKRVTLTPGTSYNVAVGQTTTSLTTSALNGQDSAFEYTMVVAKGGIGSAEALTNNTAGTGAAGSTTGGVGDVVYAGGNGGNAASDASSGGGGSGAGTTGTGNDASGITGGSAKADNGGAGANGVTTSNARNAPGTYGGGGGGAYAGGVTDRRGGDGGAGYALIDFLPPNTGLLLGVGI